VFNISDGDRATWRDFYEGFARPLGMELSTVQTFDESTNGRIPGMARVLRWPQSVIEGFGQIVTSPEFKALGRRVLSTDSIGTLPRAAMERFPALHRSVRRLVRADDALPAYKSARDGNGPVVRMGSGGAMLSIEKIRSVLSYSPPVSRTEATASTLEWIRQSRLA
jgi:hypothetical protein